GRFLHRTFKVFASLQMAIPLLALFTLALMTATYIESQHSGEIAQQLIYHTWWFILLIVLLGTNILCAALKKMDPKKLAEGRWPWKKHQTGFLVTHAGLLTLVFGGLLTNLGGEEGQVQMLDTGDLSIQQKMETRQTTDILRMSGAYTLEVQEM